MMQLPVDQEERERASNPEASFHMEAPAGAGKTSVLLARFLTLLTRVETPEELLALTFTRKAAGELRARVVQMIFRPQELGPEASPWDRRLQELAGKVFRHFDRLGANLSEVLAPERLPIMTFHSFCARLLRMAPQEAGVPLDFQTLEEGDDRWLKQEALDDLRRGLISRSADDPVRRALVRRLVRLNNNWPRLAGELRDLLGRRESLGDLLDAARSSREPRAYESLLRDRLERLMGPDLRNLAAALAATPLGRQWPGFYEALRDSGASLAASLPEHPPGAALEDLAAWQALARALLTQKGEPRKRPGVKEGFPPDFAQTPWPGIIKDLPAEFLRLLGEIQQVPPALLTEDAAALQDLVILLGEALDIYGEMCAQRRVLDFTALEEAALRLLKDEDVTDLLLRLDYRLKHLLVDEFQDTSENQMTLLCRLISGWETGAGRTVTVVGDPKQSIYGWRQAKLRLFLESRQGLPCRDRGPFPLEPLLLSTNFRSTRALITWVNDIFQEVMSPGEIPEMDFHPAAPRPGAAQGEAPRLALFAGDDSREAREAEALWLAARVAQAETGLPAGEKIGILLFQRTHLPIYLQALHRAGLAVKVREGRKLLDSRVVEHLHNLARALVRPQDDLAWAALLRGPWGCHSLALLARVALTPGDLWLDRLMRFAEEPDCPPDLSSLAHALTAARGQVGRKPLAEVARLWLDRAAAWPGIAAWEGSLGVANARTYLDLLAGAEMGLPEDTFEKADFSLQEAYQPPDPRAQDSPVEILTVHGAKGLEFHTVFVPHLDWNPLKRGGNTPEPFLLEEVPDTDLQALALDKPYWQEDQSLLYDRLKKVGKTRQLKEARRLFYVAVTRAMERLCLSGAVTLKNNGDAAPSRESPLGWLWRHYAPEDLPPGTSSVWPGPEIRVEFLPEVEPVAAPAPPPQELPPPWDFSPEAAPYEVQFPSQLAEEAPEASSRWEEAGDLPRLRGEVIHRLLEDVSLRKALPSPAAVAAALRRGGLEPEAAQLLAPEILIEVDLCRDDPFLAPLLSVEAPDAVNEWLLEDSPEPGVIRRGRMDRLVFDGRAWWLLDYKTSRPERAEDWDAFIKRERDKYRPQLLAYRDMAAKAKGLAPESIRLALYFTAARRVELL